MPPVTIPVADPGTVMVAGDWHASRHAAGAALQSAAAANIEVIIQLGDFGLWRYPFGQAFLDTVSRLADRSNIHVLWLDGNHEDFDYLDTFPIDPATGLRPIRDHITHLPRGSRWTWHGVRFAAVGGATSLDVSVRTPGRDWWAQEALTIAQCAAVADEGPCDVLLTHDCPEGVPIPGIDRASSLRMWPEAALRTAWAHREQLAALTATLTPRHLFHGHYHRAYTAHVDLGYGPLTVTGLGDDDDGPANRLAVTVTDLASPGGTGA